MEERLLRFQRQHMQLKSIQIVQVRHLRQQVGRRQHQHNQQ
jgi:hypothetical protein